MKTDDIEGGGEVISDGVTVWVNDERGYCLARFGRAGIDVHQPPGAAAAVGECLFCTHAWCTADDWPLFVAKVAEHHGVTVGDHHRPRRFR